jgi:ABC-2 type transport system ATP-binding protein
LTTTPAVITDHLSKEFGDNLAVDNLDLEIPAGEVFGLLGHNGAGKTTTLRLLNGLLAPSGGSARVLGLCSETQGTEIRARTGVLTETPALDSRLTGLENLSFFADFFGMSAQRAKRRISYLLDAFDLTDRANDRVETYSRGMHQRLALARTMLHDPEVLFLDEPTSGLDPIATRMVHVMINASRSDGRTVFLCTHNLEEAERLCDRVAVLEHGRIIALGSPRQLTSRVAEQQVEIEIARGCAEHAKATVLRAVPGVTVAASDNLVRVDGLPASRIPVVVDTLSSNGIPIFRVTPRKISLEDVYFALHRRERAR